MCVDGRQGTGQGYLLPSLLFLPSLGRIAWLQSPWQQPPLPPAGQGYLVGLAVQGWGRLLPGWGRVQPPGKIQAAPRTKETPPLRGHWELEEAPGPAVRLPLSAGWPHGGRRSQHAGLSLGHAKEWWEAKGPGLTSVVSAVAWCLNLS